MLDQSQAGLLGGIEAGGTKFVCAVGSAPDQILQQETFPTEDPETTMRNVVGFFKGAQERHGVIEAVGIGTFGPADIHVKSPGYGSILQTPKEHWEGANIVTSLLDGLGCRIPVAFDTDVNAAAVGESEYGAGRQYRNLAYVTIGTGIGGGVLIDGKPLHGRMHPEIGHMSVPDLEHLVGKDTNVCPFHGSCLEGRASGTAIRARWGVPGNELPADHPAWDLQAQYLAHGAVGITAAWSPDLIIFGGGVSQQEGLMDRVRGHFEKLAGGYWSLPPLDVYLQTPELNQQAGIVGALTLAGRLLDPDRTNH
ncbi:ROK family protein [Sulfuriroseicoccus oceanibius]|uniref:fructokinase n=1 Tax=Sulfuriroseicoccus oceanibius TaxID=2707525 RepID=A0A6B3LAP9_9BACT|nr:ROK family protein [Sulfuriroseicoccus oceanibius]QQL45986.1 ROK family protein [Sulfuriroseicoccus oceanibius]